MLSQRFLYSLNRHVIAGMVATLQQPVASSLHDYSQLGSVLNSLGGIKLGNARVFSHGRVGKCLECAPNTVDTLLLSISQQKEQQWCPSLITTGFGPTTTSFLFLSWFCVAAIWYAFKMHASNICDGLSLWCILALLGRCSCVLSWKRGWQMYVVACGEPDTANVTGDWKVLSLSGAHSHQ